MIAATYRVELRINGTLIGDVRRMAQDLTWVRRRTKNGVDSISFTMNDKLFDAWCRDYNTTMVEMLKPFALDCRIVRNGVPIVGGYLATMPAYQPQEASANLNFQFDGYQNLLAGVYINPVGTQTGPMGTLVKNWIQMADARALAAGKAYGFTQGTISTMPSVDQTFDNYKTVKDAISDRCDNTSGAGKFDVYWHPNRKYDIIKDADFGEEIADYTVFYPMRLNGVTATSISAPETSGFASTVIGIGSGDVSSDTNEDTAITYTETNSDFVTEYGYYEVMEQDSSVSEMDTLQRNVKTNLSNVSNMDWQPKITLQGVQVAPAPLGEGKIWIGDTIKIVNDEDITGMTSGKFRVNELSVDITETGSETITPTLERVTTP